MIIVKSSLCEALEYDAENQTLTIQFHPNADGKYSIYKYFPVTQDVYEEMMSEGASIGKIWREKVRLDPLVFSEKILDGVKE